MHWDFVLLLLLLPLTFGKTVHKLSFCLFLLFLYIFFFFVIPSLWVSEWRVSLCNMYLAPIFFSLCDKKQEKKHMAHITFNVSTEYSVSRTLFTSNNFNYTESKCSKRLFDEMTTQFPFEFIIIIMIRKWWGSIISIRTCIKVKTENIMFYFKVMLFLSFSSIVLIASELLLPKSFLMHLELRWWTQVWMAKKKRSVNIINKIFIHWNNESWTKFC